MSGLVSGATNSPPGIVGEPGVAKAYSAVAADGTLDANNYNINSMTKGSAGIYLMVFEVDFANTNYVANITAESGSSLVNTISIIPTPAGASLNYRMRNSSTDTDIAHHLLAHGDQ